MDCGLDPEYVMNELTFKEFDYLTRRAYENRKEKYNMMRLLMWASMSPHLKEHISPEDLLKFEWDKKEEMTLESYEQEKKRIIELFNLKQDGK